MVEAIQRAYKDLSRSQGENSGLEIIRLAFIGVGKRHHTRFFQPTKAAVPATWSRQSRQTAEAGGKEHDCQACTVTEEVIVLRMSRTSSCTLTMASKALQARLITQTTSCSTFDFESRTCRRYKTRHSRIVLSTWSAWRVIMCFR